MPSPHATMSMIRAQLAASGVDGGGACILGPSRGGDDTDAINAALQRAAGRVPVFFPGRTYRVNAAGNKASFPTQGGIVVPSNSRLVFAPGAKIEVIPNALPFTMAVSVYGVENVVIEGAHIVGDRDTHTYPNWFDSLADLNAGTNWRTKENYADTFVPYDGMVAYIPTGADEGRYVRQLGAWVRTGAYNPTAYATHEFGYGISIQDSQNVRVVGCRIEDCTGDGIYVGQDPTPETGEIPTGRIFVTGNYLARHRRQGISIVRGDDVLITNNHFHEIGVRSNGQDGTPPRAGIDVESGGAFKTHNVLVAGNVFKDCVGWGFIQFDGDVVTVAGNVFDGCGAAFTFAVGSSFVGNTLYGGYVSGATARTPRAFTYTQTGTVVTMTFSSTAPYYDASRIFVEFADAAGLRVESGYFTVTKVSGTVFTVDIGVALSLASGNGSASPPTNDLLIADNVIVRGGITVNGAGTTVRGNAITVGRNTGTGIFVSDSATDTLVTGNQVQGGNRGVWVVAGAQRTKVSGNHIRDTASYAIHSSGTDTSITDNSVYRCFAGVLVQTAAHRVSGNDFSLAAFAGTPIYAIRLGGAGVRHVCAGNTVADAATYGIYVDSPSVVEDNRITGFNWGYGVRLLGNASGALVRNNRLESAYSTGSGTGTGIQIESGVSGARVIGNVLVHRTGTLQYGINSSGGGGNVLTNNLYSGTINSNANDTLSGNAAY